MMPVPWVRFERDTLAEVAIGFGGGDVGGAPEAGKQRNCADDVEHAGARTRLDGECFAAVVVAHRVSFCAISVSAWSQLIASKESLPRLPTRFIGVSRRCGLLYICSDICDLGQTRPWNTGSSSLP